MIINCRAITAAPDMQVATEVSHVLERRSAMKHPPVSLAISDSVALGIASIFSSPTTSGRVFQRFHRSGSIDSAELIEAAAVEQSFASPEGHAALYCLIGWARAHESRAEA